MTGLAPFGVAGVALFALGLHALLVHGHLVRKILALNIMGSGIFLVFGSAAARDAAGGVDPTPHAMVITGIVVAAASTALALALARRIAEASGVAILPEDRADGSER